MHSVKTASPSNHARLNSPAPPQPAKTPDVKVATAAVSKSAADKLDKAIKDAKVAAVKAVVGKEDFGSMYDTIAKDYPSNLDLAVYKLQHADSEGQRAGEGGLDAVVAAADAVIALIDTTALAVALGTNVDPDEPITSDEADQRMVWKTALVDALSRKALALYEVSLWLSLPLHVQTRGCLQFFSACNECVVANARQTTHCGARTGKNGDYWFEIIWYFGGLLVHVT